MNKSNSGSNSGTKANIVLAGVGGQGSITSGQIAARAASIAGCDVVMSEVHGMAQRGGSVMSTVRYGAMQSPVVSLEEADFLLGFEKLEALRCAPYLRADGVAIVSDQQIIPTIEALKKADYPRDIDEKLHQFAKTVVVLPALSIAEKLGNPRLVGSVILGSFSAFLDIRTACWEQALGEIVPPKTISLNLMAFEAGHDFTCDTKIPERRKVAGDMDDFDNSYFVTA